MDTTKLLDLIETFDFKGVSFVAIKGYCSDKSGNSEVADILINVGTSYENIKKSDLVTLQNADASKIANEEFGQALIQQGIDEKIESIVNPSVARSNGQKEAYVLLGANGNLKYCKETKSISISGVVVTKKIIVAGEYKKVNSSAKTLAKKYIDKVLNLKMAKLRYYKISNILSEVRVKGDTIEIG